MTLRPDKQAKLEYDEAFVAAVEKGRASARGGELLEHDEVVDRIERMLYS